MKSLLDTKSRGDHAPVSGLRDGRHLRTFKLEVVMVPMDESDGQKMLVDSSVFAERNKLHKRASNARIILIRYFASFSLLTTNSSSSRTPFTLSPFQRFVIF